MNAGKKLRARREALGLTIREVEAASEAIVARHRSDGEFRIPIAQVSYLENRGVVPNIHEVFALSVIYRLDYREILAWYGVEMDRIAEDLTVTTPPNSHRLEALQGAKAAKIPVRLDPSFDLKRTCNLGRMIERWGIVPLSLLSALDNADYSYAYIGSQDLT